MIIGFVNTHINQHCLPISTFQKFPQAKLINEFSNISPNLGLRTNSNPLYPNTLVSRENKVVFSDTLTILSQLFEVLVQVAVAGAGSWQGSNEGVGGKDVSVGLQKRTEVVDWLDAQHLGAAGRKHRL